MTAFKSQLEFEIQYEFSWSFFAFSFGFVFRLVSKRKNFPPSTNLDQAAEFEISELKSKQKSSSALRAQHRIHIRTQSNQTNKQINETSVE